MGKTGGRNQPRSPITRARRLVALLLATDTGAAARLALVANLAALLRFLLALRGKLAEDRRRGNTRGVLVGCGPS